MKLEDFAQIAKSAHFSNGSAANLRLEEIRALAKDIDAQAKGNKDIKIIEENIKVTIIITTDGSLGYCDYKLRSTIKDIRKLETLKSFDHKKEATDLNKSILLIILKKYYKEDCQKLLNFF